MELQKDYGLRRLFQLPLDYLPMEERLQRYKQRDLIPSHLFRIGIRLFGNAPLTRTRVFEASQYSPPKWQPRVHPSRVLQPPDKEQEQEIKLDEALKSPRKPSEFTEADYREWVEERMRIREGLEDMGVNERWLCSKNRTPAEEHLLAQLREKNRLRQSRIENKDHTSESRSGRLTQEQAAGLETRRMRMRIRRRLLKDAIRLEKFVSSNRQRLADFLVAQDLARDHLITADNLIAILKRLKAPLDEEDETLHLILTAVIREKKRSGNIDYQVFLKGAFTALIEKHITNDDTGVRSRPDQLLFADESFDEAPKSQAPKSEEYVYVKLEPGFSSQGIGQWRSTMEGQSGEWAAEYKREALRQFDNLMTFCREHDITLNRETAERALLLPADRRKGECRANMRQAGLHLMKYTDLVPDKPMVLGPSLEELQSRYGWQYKEIRGGKRPKTMRLSTGVAEVKAKTDCWMTYEEFITLTKHIRSRPGFRYKYHGLPSNNAFWAGALLDKLRLYLPQETQHTKPYTLYNIFQCVQRPRIYNPTAPAVNCRTTWPENETNHVQLGPSLARTKATHCL